MYVNVCVLCYLFSNINVCVYTYVYNHVLNVLDDESTKKFVRFTKNNDLNLPIWNRNDKCCSNHNGKNNEELSVTMIMNKTTIYVYIYIYNVHTHTL